MDADAPPSGNDEAFALLDALYRSAPVGLVFWDTQLRYQRLNDRLAEINGPSAEEHIGRTPEQVLGELGTRVEALLREVLQTGRALVGHEVSGVTPAQPGRLRHWNASYYRVESPAGVPLGVGGVVLEVTSEREAAERERAALEEMREARRRAEALADAAAAVGRPVRPEAVLGALTHALVPAFADWCTIHLANGSSAPQLLAVAHADPGREALAWELNERYPASPDDPAGAPAVIRSGEPQFFPEIPEELLTELAHDDEHLRMVRELQLRSGAVLPLKARGSVLGAMTLVFAESGRTYDESLFAQAEGLAGQAAIALDNARLHREQREVAHLLQAALLPAELPEVPGLEVAAAYRASGRSNEAGGDFYDLFPADDGRWWFIIGDVVGKGPEAAAVTAQVRHSFRALALHVGKLFPALFGVNHAVRAGELEVRFATAVAGVLTPGDDRVDLELVSAGHPPPLVLRADGRLDEVDLAGTLLGVFDDPSFPEAALTLAPGDSLVLYTDGATELRGRMGSAEATDLRAVVTECAGLSPADLVERIEHQALVLSQGDLRDDLALLAMRAVAARPQGS